MVATSSQHPEDGRSRRPSLVRLSAPPPPPPAPTFEVWLEGYRERGLLPPVAQLVSVLDDVLSVHADFGAAASLIVELDGRARGEAPALAAVCRWLELGLGGEADRPAVAHAFLARLSAEPPQVPVELAARLKETFGAPAPWDEVAAAVRASTPPVRRPEAPAPALARDLAAETADLPEILEAAGVPFPLATDPDGDVAVSPEPLPPSDPPAPAQSTPPPRGSSGTALAVDLGAPTADLVEALAEEAAPTVEQSAAPLAPTVDEDLPTLRPVSTPAPITAEEEPLPVPEPVADEAEIPTDPPIRPRGAASIRVRLTDAAALAPQEAGAEAPGELDKDGRPVVRHVAYRDRPVSLQMAPAARKSAQPVPGGESIILPAERRGSPWWLLLLAVAGGAIYALFFR